MIISVLFLCLAAVLLAAAYLVSGTVRMHNISGLVAGQQKNSVSRGYFALDLRKRFLCCSRKAAELVPGLSSQPAGRELLPENEFTPFFLDMLDAYEKDGTTVKKFGVGEKTYICEINRFRLRLGSRYSGWLFDIRDGTEEQKVLDVMTAYNETLNAEVREKTENILNIQQKIVLGMANIIENRDNNTGGHVRRTSDIIHIIVDEIIRQGDLRITDEFARDIVRAAPMHDLGKVTIDSSILCKPGKLTDEEFRIMRTHSAKSGEMVLILLDKVEEDHFVHTAFNVARYHHERWDGRGYPEGLVGTMIPLEARIMAVADVYDALVSKRCYKEPMSFEQARRIMCEGMGTQFDPNMKAVFLGCREKLEEYYRSAE